MIGTPAGLATARYTSYTIRTAIGWIAGPLNPPRPRDNRGRRVCTSILIAVTVFTSVSPNADVVKLSGAAVEAGADGLTLVNTVTAMSIDVHTRRPRLSRGRGGLSGPAIHPIAVRMVHDVYRAVAKPAGVPIIGLGGVLRWEDAAEFILVGASAVGVGTALFVDPRTPVALAKGLAKWVRAQGATSITELIGAMDG